MDRVVNHLILQSLAQEHAQVWRVLELMRLNLDSLRRRPSVRSTQNIQHILDYLGNQIAGQHCRKENIIFCAVRDSGYRCSLVRGNLDNEHQRVEALISKASVVLDKYPESASSDPLNAFYTLITVLHNHIQIEERFWFPAARQYLSWKDWERVIRSISAIQEEHRLTTPWEAEASRTTREYRRILVTARPSGVQSY